MRHARMCLMFMTASVLVCLSILFFPEVRKLTRSLPREINHPVLGPGFAAIHGAVTFSVGRPFGDPRPGEPRENVAPILIFPLAVKIDGVAFKSSAPDQEATRRGRVRPRMFPLGGLRIEGAKTKSLDHRSLIWPLEEFQGNAAIQDFACHQRTGSLAPGSIAQRKSADGVPLAFEKIKLLFRVRGFGNHLVHTTPQSVQGSVWSYPSRAIPGLICRPVQCASSDSSFNRVSVPLQFTSQVLPPSSENACSKRHEFGVMSEITNRTKMARPFTVSWSKNSPRPFFNSPIVGRLRLPLMLLEKFRLH